MSSSVSETTTITPGEALPSHDTETPSAWAELLRQDALIPRLATARPGFIRRSLARLALRLGGWTRERPPPDLPRYVIVAAPHTYWWDGFWMLAFAWCWGLRVSWMVKISSTQGIFGWLLRLVGAIPVDRGQPNGLVSRLVEEFDRRDSLLVVVPPEGTRSRRKYWKSGFYHIAHQARIPICLSYLDYKRKVAGCGPCFTPTGDYKRDMDLIRDFYKDIQGKVPEDFTEPRLREEDQPGESLRR